MSKCWTIEIIDPVDIDDHFKVSGRVFVDLDEKSIFEEQIDQIKLDQNNDNNVDASSTIKVPYSEKNHLLFRNKIDVGIVDQKFESYNVMVVVNGVLQDYDYLSVQRKSDSGQFYQIILTDKKVNPLILSSKLKPCDLTYEADTPSDFGAGVFRLTQANIEAQFNKFIFQDGDPGYLFGFAWYGRTFVSGKFTAIDMRPWYSPLYILREGFKQIGFTFSCPALETTLFRNSWMYLSDGKYGGNSKEKLDRHRFLVLYNGGETFGEISSNQSNARDFPFTEILDQTGSFDSTDMVYTFPVGIDMEILIQYDLDVSNVPRTGKIVMQFVYFDLSLENVIDPLADTRVEALLDITIDLEVDEELNYVGSLGANLDKFSKTEIEIAQGWFTMKAPDDVIVNSIKVYNRPIHKRYIENDFIPMGEPINCDLSITNIFKAVQHAIGGYSTIDFNHHKVSLDIPYDADLFSDTVIGYLKEDGAQDLTRAIICATQDLSSPDKAQKRYKKYGFKKSTDAHIKSLDLFDGENNPFDKSIDLGDEYSEGTSTSRNPLVEATLLDEVPDISKDYPVHLAQLLDEISAPGDPQFSYDIGPRWCLASPITGQNYKDEEGNVLGPAHINWYDSNLATYTFFYNSIEGENFDTTVGLTRKLVYGDEVNDLWSLLISVSLSTDIISQVVQFSFHMSPDQWSNFLRNNSIFIKYGYEFIVGFMKSMRYNHCTGMGKLTMVVPVENHVINSGELISVDERNNCLLNDPKIKFETIGPNHVFTMVGTNVSTVSSVAFIKQESDPDGVFREKPSLVTNTTSISYEQPIQTVPKYKITLRVIYTDGCATKFDTYFVDDCGSFSGAKLNKVFDLLDKKPKVRINLNGSLFSGTISTISSTIRIDGGSPESYVIDVNTLVGPYVSPDTSLENNFTLETLVINYTNGCTYTLPAPLQKTVSGFLKANGSIISGTVSGERIGFRDPARYEPDLSGILLSKEPISTIVMYRSDNTDSLGLIWTKKGVGPVSDPNLEFKAVFQFDDAIIETGWTPA